MPNDNQLSGIFYDPNLTDNLGNVVWTYDPPSQTLYIGQAGLNAPWLTSFICNVAKNGGQFAVGLRDISEVDLDLVLNNSGFALYGYTLFDANLNLYLPTATPATATSSGNKGAVCYDANYLYVCIANNTWRRMPLAAGW